jgi:hypothetical protein
VHIQFLELGSTQNTETYETSEACLKQPECIWGTLKIFEKAYESFVTPEQFSAPCHFIRLLTHYKLINTIFSQLKFYFASELATPLIWE